MSTANSPIALRKVLSYGLFSGSRRFAVVSGSPANGFLTGVVATQYGFDLVLLGSVLVVLNVLDMIWDPLIGIASDTRQSRWGQRRPWIIAGTFMTVVVGVVLFYPRESMSVWLFAGLYGLFNFVGSMVMIPFQAMSSTLTRDVWSRDKLYFLLPLIGAVFGAASSALPLLPIFETNRLTVEVYTVSVLVFGALAVPFLYILFRELPEEQQYGEPGRHQMGVLESLRQAYALLKVNRPFLYLVGINLLVGIGGAGSAGLYFFWFDGYLGLGEHVAMLGIVSSAIGLIAPLVGLWITRFMARKTLYGLTMLLSPLLGIFLFQLTPETPYVLPLFLFLGVGLGSFSSSIARAVARALQADVIDYGRLKTGFEGAGLYASAQQIIYKIETSLLGGVAIIALGWFGYQPGADTQPEHANTALRALVHLASIPTSLGIAILLFKFPLTTRRMETIHRRLRSRRARRLRA